MKSPTYGTSTHYEGAQGKDYFDWQNQHGLLRGEINARKFNQLTTSSDTLLDFGCGGGHLLAALPAGRRMGVEINAAAREAAEGVGIEVYADIDEVPDQVVDVAISNHALEHVPYPIEALRQIRRTLKPGGRFRLCVPIDDWRVQRHWDPTDINHHLNTWSPLLLGNSLVEAGFEVTPSSLRVLTHAWPPGWASLYRRSPRVFDVISRAWSVFRRRRQIIADVPAS